ncbi:MAG: Amidase [Hyphomicrobiales bacterium]|nr:Amidase [Hyphomicrobiales bacterium]
MSAAIEDGVVALASAIARGETTSEAITRTALSRLETRGRRFNGVVLIEAERALSQAREVDAARAAGKPLGLLAGVPMAHKDLFYRTGRIAACGSKIRRGFKPSLTATALSRLDEAGAVDCGTLHMAEFALSPTGYNEHEGHGLNPWNPDHVCGGSSSGSGIAVASACVPAALGSDTGGSIRHPSAMCGVTGLKPTHGAVSLAGAMPLSATLDCVGPLARHARDVARLHDVLAGYDAADPTTFGAPPGRCEAALTGHARGLRMARPVGYYAEALDDEVAAALDEACRVFTELGATATETTPPDMGRINSLMHLVMSVEAATLHRQWLESQPQDYADQVRGRIEPGLFYPATRYVEALAMRGPLTREWIETVIGAADCAILPTLPLAVPTIAETTDGSPEDVAAVIGRVTRNTRGINYLGLPAVALPCGFSASGLPISMQIVGRPWSEPLLLRIADAFQRVTCLHEALPPDLDLTAENT